MYINKSCFLLTVMGMIGPSGLLRGAERKYDQRIEVNHPNSKTVEIGPFFPISAIKWSRLNLQYICRGSGCTSDTETVVYFSTKTPLFNSLRT